MYASNDHHKVICSLEKALSQPAEKVEKLSLQPTIPCWEESFKSKKETFQRSTLFHLCSIYLTAQITEKIQNQSALSAANWHTYLLKKKMEASMVRNKK